MHLSDLEIHDSLKKINKHFAQLKVILFTKSQDQFDLIALCDLEIQYCY